MKRVGFISLQGLYEIYRDRGVEIMHGRSESGLMYGKAARKLAEQIPELPGHYIWGSFRNNRTWEHIYLGLSTEGKTSNLRARITEELKDERPFIPAYFNTEPGPLLETYKTYFPNYREASRRHFERSIRKVSTTHIVWCAQPRGTSSDVIKDIERDLIEIMNSPANRSRPMPPAETGETGVTALLGLRKAIHDARRTAFTLK